MAEFTDLIRALADKIPANEEHRLSVLNMARGGLNSAANWLDQKPTTQDVLSPLGLAALNPVGRAATTARPGNWLYKEAQPLTADELAKYAGMFPRSDKPPSAPLPASQRLMPAVQVDGKAFAEGPTHSDAMGVWLKTIRKPGDPFPDLDAMYKTGRLVDGFTLPDGTFLNRKQAMEHVDAPRNDYGLESDRGRDAGFVKSDGAGIPIPAGNSKDTQLVRALLET